MKNYGGYSDDQLIGMLREGEQEIADYLVDKYKNLVRRKARALYLAGGDHEDLIQEGMLGLLKQCGNTSLTKRQAFIRLQVLVSRIRCIRR